MKYKDFYITYIKDCCENKGGYFCQIYLDSNLDYEVDNFCIHAEELHHNKIEDMIISYMEQYEKDLQGAINTNLENGD